MAKGCITPFRVSHDGANYDVPCGKCPTCVARRTSQWSYRLQQQGKDSFNSHFITLTYDTKHVPITPAGYMGLSKRDIQLFIKRLRKNHGGGSIKYYCCGEYGGKTNRPHYHIILFNCLIELVQPSWQLGHVHYGTVTGASIGYTLKYMAKKGRIPMHSKDDRQPEFSLMSKGLGKGYITDKMTAWHYADLKNRMYCNLPDGRKIGMPRYYKDKIYDEVSRKIAADHARDKNYELEQEERRKQGEKYDWNRLMANIAAFERMRKKSTDSDKL